MTLKRIALGVLTTLSLGGCHVGPQALVPASGDAVITHLLQEGDRSIAVTLQAPVSADYKTQATVHRWVDNDIYQYDVALKVWNGSSYVDLNPAIAVVVPRKVTPKTKAVFTNLRQGSKYQVSVVAKGNVGGTAATVTLNSTPATATFDFTGTQDVENTLAADLRIVFDAVAFNGSGTTTVQTPVEGTYQNPSEAETGSAL